MSKRNKSIFLIIFLIIMSFITVYVGHFLFTEKKDQLGEPQKKVMPYPVLYKHISSKFMGYKQEINILEIDVKDNRVSIKPILSYDSIFGFESLSSIANREKAYAAVNGGFFYQFGNPSGMVVIDGKVLNMSTGKFPVLIVNNGTALLKEIKSVLLLENNQIKINIDGINTFQPKNGIRLYTSEFGNDNRISDENISVSIFNNKVTAIGKYTGKVKIPKDGLILTFLKPFKYNMGNIPFKVGDTLKLNYYPDLGKEGNAYECGSWIVRAGKVVIKEKDPWVGVMTNHDPRTIAGIKNDGKLIFMTVDGRQPGYSTGMTGKELGAYLLAYGINNAAMLDGGASTEMIVKGKIVNKPSAGKPERPVGGGIIIRLSD